MTLSPKVREFLCEPGRYAVLATLNPDGAVQQTVMWYDLRDGAILMNTKRGRKKDRNMLRDGRISICIEDGERFVTIAGVAEVIDDHDLGQRTMHELAIKYVGPERAARQVADQYSKEERVAILLRPEKVLANNIE